MGRTTDAAERWFEVADRSPVALFLVDGGEVDLAAQGRVDFANHAAELLMPQLGFTDGLPESIFEIIGEADRVSVVEQFERFRRSDLATNVGSPFEPVRLRTGLASVIERDRDSGPDALDRTLMLHLQDGPDDSVIVQVVPSRIHGEADFMLVQQQRFRSALMELSELADSATDDEEFYQRLIERAVDVVPGAQGGSVQLNLEGSSAFRFVAASGYDLAGLQRHDLDRGHFFRDTWDPAARIVRDFDHEARTDEITEWLETVGRLSEIVVNVSAPVLVDGLPVAFLSLDNFEDPSAFDDTSVEMTTVLSRLIGALWRRRQLEAEVRQEREAFRHEALHDPLTALPNRRGVERFLSDAIESARRRGHPSAVLFVDIDDFKGVNDRLGHDVGDLLLIGVANGLKDVVRVGDVVGRWGGDEFLAVPLRLESPEAVEALAGRILQRFETALELSGELTYRARLSVGIGWSTDSGVEGAELIAVADDALYEAKAAGKGLARLRKV